MTPEEAVLEEYNTDLENRILELERAITARDTIIRYRDERIGVLERLLDDVRNTLKRL
jgi:hypothetical protein